MEDAFFQEAVEESEKDLNRSNPSSEERLIKILLLACYCFVVVHSPPKVLVNNSDHAVKLKVMLEHADPFIIDVRRSWILRDALKEAKKKKFQPRMQMKVSYMVFQLGHVLQLP